MDVNKKDRKSPTPNGPENGSFIHPFEDPRKAPSRKLS
jgi:hypothetical protein